VLRKHRERVKGATQHPFGLTNRKDNALPAISISLGVSVTKTKHFLVPQGKPCQTAQVETFQNTPFLTLRKGAGYHTGKDLDALETTATAA